MYSTQCILIRCIRIPWRRVLWRDEAAPAIESRSLALANWHYGKTPSTASKKEKNYYISFSSSFSLCRDVYFPSFDRRTSLLTAQRIRYTVIVCGLPLLGSRLPYKWPIMWKNRKKGQANVFAAAYRERERERTASPTILCSRRTFMKQCSLSHLLSNSFVGSASAPIKIEWWQIAFGCHSCFTARCLFQKMNASFAAGNGKTNETSERNKRLHIECNPIPSLHDVLASQRRHNTIFS